MTEAIPDGVVQTPPELDRIPPDRVTMAIFLGYLADLGVHDREVVQQTIDQIVATAPPESVAPISLQLTREDPPEPTYPWYLLGRVEVELVEDPPPELALNYRALIGGDVALAQTIQKRYVPEDLLEPIESAVGPAPVATPRVIASAVPEVPTEVPDSLRLEVWSNRLEVQRRLSCTLAVLQRVVGWGTNQHPALDASHFKKGEMTLSEEGIQLLVQRLRSLQVTALPGGRFEPVIKSHTALMRAIDEERFPNRAPLTEGQITAALRKAELRRGEWLIHRPQAASVTQRTRPDTDVYYSANAQKILRTRLLTVGEELPSTDNS